MAKESHSLLLLLLHLLLSFLIVLSVLFVSCSHGSSMQAKAHGKFHKSKLKGENPEMDKSSDFKAEEIVMNSHHYHHHHRHDLEVDDEERLMKEKDRILKLPGQPEVRFSQYGGYVSVDEKAGRAFYYYFVEAQRNKESLPLLLWLNGGPGCSSLAYGAMQELGPFRVHSDGKTLYKNRYPWNYAANVLFVESPAGVGFSYSNTSSDYDDNGDKKTAADNYMFLLNWLKRFPEYKTRDLYITGESYAGHYVPQLANTILRHNTINPNNAFINLKGIMIGNAVINDETDSRGMYEFLGSHAIISDSTAKAIGEFCDFSPNAKDQGRECNAAMDEAERDVAYIDIYNIYAPLCINTNLTATPKPNSNIIDPCSDYYVSAYLNRGEVQEALHANVTKLKYEWSPCSDVITKWLDSPSTILPLLQQFLNHGLRVWIFSGDVDGRVPVTSTLDSINKMNLEVKTSWHPWFFNGEVGGYTQVYKGNLTFATVRGAGHQVPSYEPARALSLIKHFLNGTPLPNTKRF